MGYNNYNRGFEINEEKTADFLVNAVEKITTESMDWTIKTQMM